MRFTRYLEFRSLTSGVCFARTLDAAGLTLSFPAESLQCSERVLCHPDSSDGPVFDISSNPPLSNCPPMPGCKHSADSCFYSLACATLRPGNGNVCVLALTPCSFYLADILHTRAVLLKCHTLTAVVLSKF